MKIALMLWIFLQSEHTKSSISTYSPLFKKHSCSATCSASAIWHSHPAQHGTKHWGEESERHPLGWCTVSRTAALWASSAPITWGYLFLRWRRCDSSFAPEVSAAGRKSTTNNEAYYSEVIAQGGCNSGERACFSNYRGLYRSSSEIAFPHPECDYSRALLF